MPLDFDIDEIEKKEGGRGLRRKLEEALAENRKLSQVAIGAKAQEVIGAQKLSLVKAEDLAGVELDKLEERAVALQTERQEAQESTVRGILAGKGLEGEALDEAVKDFLGGQEPVAQEDSPWGAVHEAAAADGKPTPAVDPSKLHGVAAIEYALLQQERKRK